MLFKVPLYKSLAKGPESCKMSCALTHSLLGIKVRG
jgi:hypothetical protein